MGERVQSIHEFSPVSGRTLAAGEVHVWTFRLDVAPTALGELASALSEPELERAGRFRFDQHQTRYIAGRGSLRFILGQYLNTDPAQLRFAYGPYGKPELAGKASGDALHFNLAHSADVGVLAVTRLGAVGVDVEQIRPLEDAEALVARFFSPRESRVFRALPAEQKARAFYRLWTRKEAWLKATGEGIAHSLHLVEVSFLPGEPAHLRSLPAEWATLSWQLHDLALVPDFASALVVAGLGDVRLRSLRFGTSQSPELAWSESLDTSSTSLHRR